jgi:glycerophosphoryl diester phosphodiesterase
MDNLRSRIPSAAPPLIIGHRGASGRLPENTLAAFRGAFDDGADGIELDVRLSADGVPVVIHDSTMTRTTGLAWRVGDRTSGELAATIARNPASRRRALAGPVSPAASNGLGVPTLEEALDLARSRRGIVYVELKGASATVVEFEQSVARVLRRHAQFERVVVLSFNHAALRRVKRLEPRIRTAATVAPTIRSPRPSPEALARLIDRANADEAALHVSLATKRRIALLHERGKRVSVWTVNSPIVGRVVSRFGVDALMTDFPARFVDRAWRT